MTDGKQPDKERPVLSRAAIWISALFTLLIVLLVVDFFFFERNSPLELNFPDEGTSKRFIGSVVMSEMNYDRQTKSATAQLGLEIKTTNPELEVSRVAFSYQENSDGSRDINNCSRADSCFTEYEDVSRAGGKPLTTVRIQFGSIRLQMAENRPEILYPFDKSSAKLSLLGCVNKGLEACTADSKLFLQTIKIELSDPDFTITGDGASFSIERKFFVRLVSVVFLIISFVFFVYLVRLNKPDELMTKSLGLFGTLWGVRSLLVPGTIKVFPTLVDYVILSVFCFLFILIVIRVQAAPAEGGGST
jgi:hypothetical protein